MTSYGPEREADRIRVIIETLAYAHPDMPLKEAAPAIFEIEKRTAELESPHVAGADDFTTARGVARWINKADNKDIQDMIVSPGVSAGKIHAIKEVRARTALGLREAKEGVEAWERGDHLRP